MPPPERPFFGPGTAPEDVLVAEIDGGVVGYLRLVRPSPHPSQSHVLHIVGLAVDPRYRRQGFARALVLAAIDEASARGARRLTLRVLGPNTGARALYESCGFTVEGVLRQEFLVDGRFVDDVLMARWIDLI